MLLQETNSVFCIWNRHTFSENLFKQFDLRQNLLLSSDHRTRHNCRRLSGKLLEIFQNVSTNNQRYEICLLQWNHWNWVFQLESLSTRQSLCCVCSSMLQAICSALTSKEPNDIESHQRKSKRCQQFESILYSLFYERNKFFFLHFTNHLNVSRVSIVRDHDVLLST